MIAGESLEIDNRFNSIIFCNDASCGVNLSPDSTGELFVGLLLFNFGRVNFGRFNGGVIFMLAERIGLGESLVTLADVK